MSLRALTIICCAATWLCPLPHANLHAKEKAKKQEVSTTRYAVMVGANEADASRETLRYAIKDARAMADVLEEFGGVERAILLEDPAVEELEEELATIDALAKKTQTTSRGRQELIFYYSGHSDESGLLLGDQTYPYQALRERLEAMDVDVRVVILDSCASGNMTRKKGGERTPAFLQDASTDVRGQAFLTSSAANESAQESDRLKGSFFTHALVAGLRGAADHTGDRRVTLQEAYQYAFEETLAKTQRTLGGAQHASHDFDLTGHGELVLTDYSDSDQAIVQLSRTLRGQVFIWNAERQLVAEINKLPGQEIELALPKGRYEIQLLMPSRAGTASVKLEAKRVTRLSEELFEELPREVTASRGTLPYSDVLLPAPERRLAIGVDLLPRVGVSTFYPDAIRYASLNVLVGQSGGLRGGEISGLGSVIDGSAHGIQIAGVGNIVNGSLRGVQIAGLLNIATRGARGTQLGTLNYSGDDLSGSQLGVLNVTRAGLFGGQAGLVNLQLSSTLSNGFQVGGLNINQRLSGVQLGVANLHLGEQIKAEMEHEENKVVQAGVVNIATTPVKGFMVGVVNTAPTTSASFGLVNVFWEEPLRLTAWTNSEAGVSVGVIHGARSTYSLYSVGTQHLEPREDRPDTFSISPARYTLGLGYGWRKRLSSRVRMRADIMGQWLLAEPNDLADLNLLTKARVGFIFELSDTIALHAGPSFNALITRDNAKHGLAPPGSFVPYDETTLTVSPSVRLWPGVFLGVDFF